MFARKGTKRWLWLVAMISVFALTIAACGDDDDDDDDGGDSPEPGFTTVTIAPGETIKIGISAPLTGSLASIGVPIAEAAKLAGEGVEIEGFAIEFVEKDDLCTADGAGSAATQIIEEGVVGVVGPICSGAVAASQPAFDGAGVSFISPSATAVSLVDPEGRGPFGSFFRIPTSDGVQGVAQAAFARGETIGAETVYILHDTDVYGSGLAAVFEESFEEDGGEVLGVEGYEKETTDFSAIVTNIEEAGPDLVYLAGFYPEATPFLQQLRAALPDVPFLSGDGVRDDAFLTGAGDDAEGAYLSLPSQYQGGDVAGDFSARFEEATGETSTSTPFLFESFDAATAIIMGIQEVAVLDGDSLTIDLEALADAIRALVFDGTSGPVAFGDNGDNSARADTEVTFFRVENGAYVELD